VFCLLDKKKFSLKTIHKKTIWVISLTWLLFSEPIHPESFLALIHMAPLLQYRLLPANYHLSQRLNIDNPILVQNQIYPLTKTQHQQPNLCAKSITQSLFFHRGSKLNDDWNDSCVFKLSNESVQSERRCWSSRGRES
jgi:hypothetical protein